MGHLLDATFEVENETNSVQNTLILYNLKRNHLFRSITCKAHHSEYGSLEETVSLDMNRK